MKLITTIAPRRSGVVAVLLLSGLAVNFKPDESGDLSAEIESDTDVAHLLALPGGNFEPANAEDFDRAEALVGSLMPNGEADADGDDDGEGDEPGPDDEIVNGGLPVEANTPPTPARAAKAAAKAAKAAAAQG
ncbi:MAG: hypothetical protein KA784_00070 [Aquabacterium sp.]|nr:hypothetical protein [Aquabacterium sp.]